MSCGHLRDVFMLSDDVWASTRLDGWACVSCVEAALRRELTATDFKPNVPCNSLTRPDWMVAPSALLTLRLVSTSKGDEVIA